MSGAWVFLSAAFIGVLIVATTVFAQPGGGLDGSMVNGSSSISPRTTGQPQEDGVVTTTSGGPTRLDGRGGIQWGPLVHQSILILSVAQGFRIITQTDTRDALRGPYFRDYSRSLRGVGGWRDGDPMITNYVGHPLLGSTYMRVFTQNDPGGAPQEFSFSNGPYWKHRLKAFGYSSVMSTIYELSPVGDAAIGNVGLDPSTKGAVDLVITPTVGMGWNVSEDMVDEYFIRWVEGKTGNVLINSMVRSWLNPTRSLGNLLRFRAPWRRDSRGNLTEIRLVHEMEDRQMAPERTARR